MSSKHSFQCGTCHLYEEKISMTEVMELSALHFAGEHIDIYELRKRKRKLKERKA
jgi:hypothetical protein